MISVECGVFAIGAALLAVSRHRLVLHRAKGLLLGLAAGALFGVSKLRRLLRHGRARGRLGARCSTWVREQKLENVLPNAPKITTGEVVVQKSAELVQA